jgi:RHS repeat-associated protein
MALVKHHAQLVVVFLAIVVFVPAIATAQDEVVYYHTDAIGSVRMVTDATGAVVARYDYLPFGERFETVPPATYLDRRQFAGKERDAEIGFDYFGARFLRAESGRFLSVDPVAVTRGIIEPQLWNRYAYVTNNPFRYRDPDGRQREFLDHDIRDLAAGKITLDEYHARIQARGAGAAIGAGVVGIAIAGPIAWHAAYGCFLSPSCQGNTLEIMEGAAGGAQRPLRSDEMGKLIGWGTGQSATRPRRP